MTQTQGQKSKIPLMQLPLAPFVYTYSLIFSGGFYKVQFELLTPLKIKALLNLKFGLQ
jgi:hypothetical protein